MRIGYPCINRSIACSGNKTFRLTSYTEKRLKETIHNNLDCLRKILQFNLEHNLLFFRITSDLVPFASHPINAFDWTEFFKPDFENIGDFMLKNRMRISMHPDQFTLINSIREEVFERSKAELQYHADVLDSMNLDASAKIQIHVGGAYGDKKGSMERFVNRYRELNERIRRRLVIENDDRLYSAGDCLKISDRVKIPVLFDTFHHQLNSDTQLEENLFCLIANTWKLNTDGIPMVDYSSPEHRGSSVKHASTIDIDDFRTFLGRTRPTDFDIMLEIKDKEQGSIKAARVAEGDRRFLVQNADSIKN